MLNLPQHLPDETLKQVQGNSPDIKHETTIQFI